MTDLVDEVRENPDYAKILDLHREWARGEIVYIDAALSTARQLLSSIRHGHTFTPHEMDEAIRKLTYAEARVRHLRGKYHTHRVNPDPVYDDEEAA